MKLEAPMFGIGMKEVVHCRDSEKSFRIKIQIRSHLFDICRLDVGSASGRLSKGLRKELVSQNFSCYW